MNIVVKIIMRINQLAPDIATYMTQTVPGVKNSLFFVVINS